ncbi:MAG: CAF17-like 4Fe-4S cluster assembly/insertion protein YgfZ [Pauljensenia sp.]
MADDTADPTQDPTASAPDPSTSAEQSTTLDSWRSPLLDLDRAVAGEDELAGIPLHFGDPSGEQWALEAGNALVDRSDLGVVTVTGPDRQSWLTSIASQVLTGMGPGDSRELLVLDPQGHIEHAAAVADDGTTTWLVTEGDHAAALAQWLDSMRFALRVEVAQRPDVAVLATASPTGTPSSAPALRDLPGWILTWDDPWPGVTEGGTEYFRGQHPGGATRMHLHLVERDRVGDLARTWLAGEGRRPAGLLAWEALRVASWRPRVGREADARAIPAELDWLRTAVHINKGCYRGQESVARVLNLGRPPRRLVFLQLDGSRGDVPEPGTPIVRGGRRVGVVTSVARHADMGPIALALVARNLPVDAVLDIDGTAAAQEAIVPADGKAADSPEERPGTGLSNPALRHRDVRGTGSGGLAPSL